MILTLEQFCALRNIDPNASLIWNNVNPFFLQERLSCINTSCLRQLAQMSENKDSPYLEMVIHPWIVSIFNAVNERASS